MPKSLHSDQYKRLLELLRETREQCGYTQIELAEALGVDQAYVSKSELGVRRLDVIELRNWVSAMGVSFAGFSKRVDLELEHVSAVEKRLALGKRR
jgi:transcriptional regulator with XRE-family HTH domain